MNRSEVRALLSQAVACEPYEREVTETDVLAWHELLRDLRPEDVAGVVLHHYSSSTYRLTPSDVRRYVVDKRAGRIAKADIEAPSDPDDVPGYIRALAERKRLVGDGGSPVPELGPVVPPPPSITSRPNRNVGPLSIRCPWCKAAPREWCHSSTGRRLSQFHPSRLEAADRRETA